MMHDVAALFVRADSVYKRMPGVDAWDIERDARGWSGGCPVIAHPPCRAWGRLRHLAKPRPDEKALAILAVARIREFGGVLEHPAHSTLWAHEKLPLPGAAPDTFGGFTIEVEQFHWGHRAEKKTWLYIVGTGPSDLPTMPRRSGRPTHVIAQSRTHRIDGVRLRKGMPGWRPEVSKAEREHTPPALARWLVDLAARCARREV